MKERLTISRIIGLILGFVGVIILLGWKTVYVTKSFNLAVVAGFTACLLYAVGAPYIKNYLSDVSPLVISAGTQLSAALFILPFMAFTIPVAIPTIKIISAVISLGLLSTALGYILYFRLIQNIGASRTLTVIYLVPIFAMVWGLIFLKEPITISMILGCFLILFGVAIANNSFSNYLNRNSVN